jgi:prepilin-type N-terminal cleavage/methylation domain-containing protein
VFNNKGLTLVEIIIAMFLLAIAIVPMVNAYGPAVFSTNTEDETLVFTNQARGSLNRVMALGFATLDDNQGDPVDLAALFGSAAEAAKETFLFKGKNYVPTLTIVDASSGAGGLLGITVTVDQVSLTTLKAEY